MCNTLFCLKVVLESSLYNVALNTIFTGKPVSLELAERFFYAIMKEVISIKNEE